MGRVSPRQHARDFKRGVGKLHRAWPQSPARECVNAVLAIPAGGTRFLPKAPPPIRCICLDFRPGSCPVRREREPSRPSVDSSYASVLLESSGIDRGVAAARILPPCYDLSHEVLYRENETIRYPSCRPSAFFNEQHGLSGLGDRLYRTPPTPTLQSASATQRDYEIGRC